MEALDATYNLNVVEVNEPVQSQRVAREQEEAINETSATVEIDLVQREQEEVINKNYSIHCKWENCRIQFR
jgi:broad-specificity NMP kinase